MPIATAKAVRRVSATKFRERFRSLAAQAKGKTLILVENRRKAPKYLVEISIVAALR